MQVKKEKIIRTAIVGLGNIAHGYDDIPNIKKRIKYPTHLSVLKKDKRFQLVTAADINKKSRHTFQKKIQPNVAIYSDYRAMLKKEKTDLLVVAVPTKLHYSICSQAIKSGIKNILLEKPITATLAEAEKLAPLVKRNHVKIAINYTRSFDANYQRLSALIKKKKWGEVKSIHLTYTKGVLNIATHFIHLLENVFGPIDAVQSLTRNKKDIDDPNISFIARVGGLNIFFEGVENVDYRLSEIDAKFVKGQLVIRNDSLSEFKSQSKDGFSFLKEQAPSVSIDIGSSLLDVYESVYQFIKNNKKPVGDVTSAVHALKVAVRAIESTKSGKLLKV